MPPREYIIQQVGEYWPNPETPCWSIDMLKPDGTGHRHVFPKFTLEQRAAEYDIDPADVEQLLDIVLHEPYAPHPDDPDTEDPAAAAGLLSPALVSRGTARKGDLIPTTLYTARTAAEARAAHLLRIDEAKKNRVKVVPPKGGRDPLDTIRAGHGIDPRRVAERAAKVEQRRLLAQGRIPVPSTPDPLEAVDARHPHHEA